ncbi:MAG: universal stress protein [Bacteroidota bacterium]
MKTILIPTDFSEVSKNAVEYGVQLAQQRNAKLILLHVFHIPVIASDDPVLIPSFDELEKDNVGFLKEFETEIRSRFNFTNGIECITKPGFLIDQIEETVLEKNLDLIIMGITEAGKLSELLLGSSSIGVIKNINCPTIIIPAEAKFRPINTIVFACDLEKTESIAALEQIKKFVQLFNAHLMVFNMVEPAQADGFEESVHSGKFKTIFENINHSIHFIKGDNLVDTVNNFIDEKHADLLIMIPKKHTFFSQLFHKSSTKKMAFHTHVPLLAIHE